MDLQSASQALALTFWYMYINLKIFQFPHCLFQCMAHHACRSSSDLKECLINNDYYHYYFEGHAFFVLIYLYNDDLTTFHQVTKIYSNETMRQRIWRRLIDDFLFQKFIVVVLRSLFWRNNACMYHPSYVPARHYYYEDNYERKKTYSNMKYL